MAEEENICGSSTGLNVHIEYCNSWGYEDMVQELREKIHVEVPEASVTDEVSQRTAAFEISINEKLVFSRLQTFSYPEPNTIVGFLHDVKEGKEIPVIQPAESSCTIL